MRCFLRMAAWTFSMLPWIVGCSQPPSYTLPDAAPNLSASPEFELLNTKTQWFDRVQVVLDDSGLAYVIIASMKLKSVQCVVVGQEGVVSREVIRQSVSPSSIDAMFDKAGVLHALIDNAHYVRTDGQWKPQPTAPWHRAGVKALHCRFVPGAEDLIWAFQVGGKDTGSPGRWDWYFLAADLGSVNGEDLLLPMILPWHSQTLKWVVVPGASPSYSTWVVCDNDSKQDIADWEAAANRRGTVFAVYQAQTSGTVHSTKPKYAQFTIPDSPAQTPQDRKRMEMVSGRPLSNTPWFAGWTSIAADPNSDSALLVKTSTAWLIRNGQCGRPTPLPVKIKPFGPSQAAPAGNSRFHTIAAGADYDWGKDQGHPVLYLEFSDGRWSPPVELGRSKLANYLQIGSNGPNALVVWPKENSIVGRWVRTKQ